MIEGCGSCYCCKWLEEIEGDYGYCKYPVPAWVHLALPEHNRINVRYAPCPVYEVRTPETET